MVGGGSEERWRCETLSCDEAETGTKVRHDAGLLLVLQRSDGTKGRAFNRLEKNPYKFFGSNIESALS